MVRNWIVRFWLSFSTTGLLLGTLFFAASLTPTLLPRAYLTQGVLSGGSLAVVDRSSGVLHWLGEYMELPEPTARIGRDTKLRAARACAVVGIVFLRRATGWQNPVREVMSMEPVDSAHPLEVGLIAL